MKGPSGKRREVPPQGDPKNKKEINHSVKVKQMYLFYIKTELQFRRIDLERMCVKEGFVEDVCMFERKEICELIDCTLNCQVFIGYAA